MNGEPPESAGPEQAGDPPRRDGAGRFRKGASGNPAGRPPGRRGPVAVLLDGLAEGRAEGVLEGLLSRAEAGDVAAAEAILRRIWPAPRGRRVALPLLAIAGPADAARAAGQVVAAMGAGDLVPEDAAAALGVIEAAARLAAMGDLEARLAALEARAGLSQP